MAKVILPIPVLSDSDIARFWSFVRKGDGNGCWEWTGCLGTRGYGRISISGKVYFAHRVSFVIHGGSFTAEHPECLHSCHNPLCVRPEHLHAGNHDMNMLEKVEAGRQSRLFGDMHPLRKNPQAAARGLRHGSKTHPHKVCRGERNGRSKLSKEQVEEIRQRYAAGGIFQYQLAAEYGVTQGLITKIICRRNWT
jgi:hypothetical protein